MLTTLAFLAALAAAAQDSTHLVVVATADLHGHATAWDYIRDGPAPGGLGRAAAVVDSLRRAHPDQVVLVDAGDLLQGGPFGVYFGRVAPQDPHPVVDAMGAMGYDAATPGDHDFDFGLDAFRRALAGAVFPFVSANLRVPPADTLALQPAVVVRRGPLRLGITGFTTPAAAVWNREQLRGRLRVAPIAQGAAETLRRLKAESDFTVVLSHSGLGEPSSYDTTGVGDENAAGLFALLPQRPDLVVLGHTHRAIADTAVGGVHFVQPPAHGRGISVVHVDLVRRRGRWHPVRIRGAIVPLPGVEPAPAVARRLATPHDRVRRWAAEPVGRLRAAMPGATARVEPTPLAAFVNEVQRRRAGADLSATAIFGTEGLPQGEVRRSDVLALYPPEHTLRAVRISGPELRALLERSARYFVADRSGRVRPDANAADEAYAVVSGAEYELDLRLPPGNRVRNLRVRGRPVQPADSFTLALSSYHQNGGGSFGMLAAAPVVHDRGERIRDLLLAALAERAELDPAEFADSGWRIVPEEVAGDLRRQVAPERTASAPPARDTTILRILATSDLGGALLPGTPAWAGGRVVGGVAVLKAYMDSAAAECGCPTLRLDAGDQLQGTEVSNLTAGRAAVEALNRVGTAAAVVGERDLAWSVDTLLRRMAEARYDWVVANLFDSTGARPDWAVPYRVLEAGRLKVGVIGYLAALPGPLEGSARALVVRTGPAAVADALGELRALRPDLVVLLAHAGAGCGSGECAGEVADLARGLGPGAVDLVVAGHTDEVAAGRAAGLPVVQAGAGGAALTVVDVVRTVVGSRELRVRVDTAWADRVTPDSGVANLVLRYARAVDSIAREPVATLKLPLPRQGPEHALGNLIADAQRNALRADFAVVPDGAIHADLPAGPVDYRGLRAAQPAGGRLLRLSLTGGQLRHLLERAVDGADPSVHVSGVTVRYDPRRPPGRRVRSLHLPDGRRVDRNARYTLAVSELLIASGGELPGLRELPREATGVLDLDALTAYLRRLPQPVEGPANPRFVATR